MSADNRDLPAQLTGFIGRAEELIALQRLIDEHRMVTVTGPGGVGKTRISLEVASRKSREFDYGALFVELAPITNSALIPEAIAITLDLPRDSSIEIEALVTSRLKDRDMLLMLDNCEHLIQQCAEISLRLLQACPSLRILATSREPLGVPGEVVWRLAPLASDDAVALFSQRAAEAVPKFESAPTQLGVVAAICARLDGIPLAIELAAARLRVMTAGELLIAIEQDLTDLGGTVRVAPQRHRSLRAAFEWSYALLQPDEQRLFRLLAVFSGGFDRDAVRAVAWSAAGIENAQVQLDSLFEKSMITATADEQHATRFGMLVPLRELAVDLLTEHGELARVARCHCEYFASVAELADPGLYGPDQLAWVRRLDDDVDNFRSAIQWALDHDPNRALSLAGALTDFWSRSFRGYEGCGLIERALDSATPMDEARVRALVGLAFLMPWRDRFIGGQRDIEAAAQCAEAALGPARALGNRHRLATALEIVGRYAYEQERFERADEVYTELLDVVERPRDAGIHALALKGLGLVAWSRGERDQARSILDQAIEVARAAHDVDVLSYCLFEAGVRCILESDLEAARSYYLETIGLTDLQRQRVGGIGASIHSLALVDALQGKRHRAVRLAGFAERRLAEQPPPRTFPFDEFTRFMVETLDRTKAELGPEAEAETQAGWNLTSEQAIALATRPWEEPRPPVGAAKALEPLSPRESEVAVLVSQGMTGRQIAERLHLAERTVENHVQHALDKLNLNSRAQLAAWTARRSTLVEYSAPQDRNEK